MPLAFDGPSGRLPPAVCFRLVNEAGRLAGSADKFIAWHVDCYRTHLMGYHGRAQRTRGMRNDQMKHLK